MHIPDGVLSLPVLLVGGAGTAAALGLQLPRLDERLLPRVAVASAIFFVASLVSIPIGPTSVHPVLSGLLGLLLGWAAIPAVFVGLLLQALLFGHGGLTAIGVTTLNIALPGVLWALALRPLLRREPSAARCAMVGAAVAALAIASSAALVVLSLGLSDPAYFASAALVALTYLPLLAGEAVLTGFAMAFLGRVRPELILSLRRVEHA